MSAPKIRAFQTGRLYTSAGQRIAYAVLPSGRVAMWDRDRMVDYLLRIDGEPTDAMVAPAMVEAETPRPRGWDVIEA